MTKQQPDLRIDRLGTHLFQVTRKDGSNFLKWDWDKLLEEVQVATTTVSKKNLVKETETKVIKSRAKKAEEKVSPTKDSAKKAPAKKSAVKKSAAKKSTK